MSDSPDVITADDVAGLNRTAVTRTAALTRLAGSALIVLGALALAGAIFLSVRYQQRLDDRGDFVSDIDVSGQDGPSALNRLDTFAQTFPNWALAALPLGFGLILRLFADYAIARTGGSITGYEPGDELPGDDTLDAPQVIVTPPEPGPPE